MAVFTNDNPMAVTGLKYNLKYSIPKIDSTQKWYAGEIPTQKEMYGRILQVYRDDADQGRQMFNEYKSLQTNPASKYYRDYAQPTNRATDYLSSYGFNTEYLGNGWLDTAEANTYIRTNLIYDGATNTPKTPGKKATQDQNIAYWLYQYKASEDKTKKAEEEYQAAIKEAQYYANWADMNYSDDEIVGKVKENFATKYPTLYEMQNNAALGKPTELNRAVDFSDDALYGAIWETRNPGYEGDIEGAMAYSQLGMGKTYQEDPETTARLTQGSPDYAPYYVGATMNKELSYFGIYSADQAWVDENFDRIMAGDDETAKDYARKIADGVQYTATLNSELESMQAQIDKYIAKGFTNADYIIRQIREDTDAYGNLFGLDETMEQGGKYGILKPTTGKVAYRWQDVENEIRARCQEENDREDVVGLAEKGNTSGTKPSDRPTPAYAASGEDEADAVSGAAYRPFTETEKADEILYKNDLDAVSPVIDANGTEAEKTAFLAGDTLYFERAREQVETMLTNPDALDASVKDRFRSEYPETARTIYDYQSHETNRDALKEKQTKIDTELGELREKAEHFKSFTDMTPEEYENFQAFVASVNDESFDPHWVEILERGDSYFQDEYQKELWEQALGVVYNRIRPTDYGADPDIISAKGKEWWNLYKKMQGGNSPIDKMEQETNRTDNDVDEVSEDIELPKTNGYFEDDEDSALTVSFEKDDSGNFVFSGAVGNVTGKNYTREEADELLGYQKFDIENGMTAEEQQRLEILERSSAELAQKIKDEEGWLSANKELYDEAVMDKDTLLTAAQYNGDAELANTFDNVFGFTQSTPYADYQYMPYSFYDYYAENEVMTKEQAYASAAEGVLTTSEQLKGIDDALATLSEAGIELSEDEMKMLQKNKSDLEHINKSLAYSALNANAGFDEAAEAGKEMAESGKYGQLAKSVASGKWELEAWDYVFGFLGGAGGAGDSIIRDAAKKDELLLSMSEDEKNRFFYLLKTDGEKAAEDYFKFIADPNNGELTIRTSGDVAKRTEEFASQNWFNALLSTAASFVGKRMGNAEATANRIGSLITGEEMSSYNPAFWMSDATKGMRQGAKDWLQDEFGKNDISDKLYDVITGVVDIAIASKEMSALGSIFEGTKIGNAVLKAGQWLNNSSAGGVVASFVKDAASVLPVSIEAWNSTYQRVFDATKDADTANQMAAVAFAADIVSHAVIMKGMRKSFETDPSAFSSKLSSYFYQVFTNAGAAGTSTLITEKFTDDCERIIMEDMSTYGQLVQKYKDMDYPDSMAEHYAELEMWGMIVNHVEESVENSVIRTTVTFAANEVKNSKTYQRAKDQLQVLKEYFKPTKTEEGFIRAGEWANAPEGFHDAVPDDAIVNPIDKNGTVMYDRTTGKPHTVVAFMVTDSGDLVYIDSNGEQVPFFNIAMQGGSIAGNWTDDEYNLLSIGWNYYKDQYMPDTTGTRETVNAETPGKEPGTDIVPTGNGTANTPGLPSGTGYLPGATNNEQTVKDLSVLSNSYGSKPAATAVGLSVVLKNPDPNASKAAGQNLVSLAGDPKAAIAVTQQMIVNAPNPAETKEDIVAAALVDGSGREAMKTIIGKVTTGQKITATDIDALHNGVEEDKAADPEGFKEAAEAAVKESRIANGTIRILALPAHKNRIMAAEADAAAKKRDADNANQYMTQKQNEAQAAAENLLSAEANYNPQEDTQTGGPLQQQTEKLMGADTAATQAEDAYKQQQQIAEEAQKKNEETRNEEIASARQEATVQVEQEMADEQAARDQQAQAAAEAEQQRQALMAQEAEAENAERQTYLETVKKQLAGMGYTGDIDKQAERIVERKIALERGKVNTDSMLSEEDGEQFLNAISRQTGMTFSSEDLGNPLIFRGYINNRNDIVLNSNLSKGQALVEAALHETIHGLEDTGAYAPFSDVVLKYLYNGDQSAFDRDVLKKISEYAARGKTLTIDDAKREIVADFGRTNMANKKFIRKVVARGAGDDTRNAISKSLSLLKGYKFNGPARRQVNNFRKAERLYMEAIDERARMVKEGYNGHTGISQFSITSASQAAGLTVEVTDDENYRYKLYDADGNELAPGSFTPEMVIGTPVGKVIDLPAEIVRDELNQKVKDGLMTQEESDAEYNKRLPALQKAAEEQRKFISDIINMIGQYQDAAMVWELAGSLSFSTLKTNGDPQYSDSEDMGTICTKTQAILNVISETQVRLGRGLTKKEIDSIVYNEVGKGVQDENGNWIHGATPCPPCYVYATWVNKPARLEMIRQYQNKFGDWDSEKINEFMNAPAPSSKKAATERNRQKLWISTCLADEHKDPVTGESTWTRKDNPSICPDEILLDLRRSGDMATQYPGTWKFMQKGGNAQGKAIAPYSDSRIGETIVGKAIGAGELNARLLADAQNAGNPDYIPQFVNPFLTGDDEKAKEYFVKAIAKIKAQNLEGGQRWQSWSDGRAEWGSDYLMEMLTMQAIGAKVQTYTKVPEMLPLLASAGFEVNMSLMPEGDGFAHNEDGSIKIDEDGNPVLAFSKVTGIDPEAAEAFAKQYGEKGNVQPMVVGISDEHIKAALAGDYITFVIPFHGSGGSVKRLQHLMSLLHEKMNSGNDYTKAQTDKFISGEVNTNPNWALREAIITGNYDSLTDKQKEDIEKNDFLRKLYEDRYLNEDSPAYQVFFTKGQAQQIFPYEYWDTSTTLANADENSKRFIDYCNLLGVIPRFSGLQKKNGTEYANFSGAKRDDNGNIIGYDPVPGYWKLLIDRPMYRRIYDENGKLIKDQCTYRDPEVVNVGNIEVTAMPMAANNTVGHSDDETRQITDRVIQQILLNKGPATSAYAGNMTLGNTPSEQTENKAIIKNAMYADSDVQLSAGGDLTDAEMLSLIDEVGKAVEDLTTDDILNMFGITSLEGQNTDPQELIAETVQEIEDEFDPTIYNGRLYVKPETLDFWLSDEGFAADDPNYAQAYITTMDPNDFLRITTASEAGREIIRSEAKPLDEEKLAEHAKVQPIELFINEETGEITGHEGRHRSLALARAGVTEIPVLLFDRRTNNSKTPNDSLTLKGQDTKRRHMSNIKNDETITFDDVIPLSNAYRDELYERFTASDEERQAAEQNNQRILDYSLGGELTDAEMDQLLVQTGLINPEMIPYSNLPSTNVQSGEGTKYRQFGRKTAQESDALHEQVKDYLYKNSLYVPDTNAEQVNRALAWVKSHATESDPDGYYASLREVMDPNFNFRTADGQARMLSVMGMAAIKADQGDERALQDEIDLADAYNKQGTDLAQALQARKLFRMMTPVGRKAVLQREADRINQNLADLGKKYRVSIPDALLEEAANAKSEKDFENSRNKIRQVLNEQIPVTWGERIIGWRMLSMLSAPKTHIRNIGGNLMFVPVVGTKNKVAAIIEAGAQKFGKLDKDERTKTIGLANPAARKFASSRTNDIEDILRGNAKYGEGDKRQQERKIFGTKDNAISKTFGKALQWWYDANGKALEWEDWLFLKYHYTRALGGYMTARGLKPEDMKGTVLEDADMYAIQEAHKATYRDDSPVANWMNKIGSKKANADNNKALSVIQWIVNTRFPFKRTPINIAKRGIEYSPVGLGKSLTYDLAHLKQYLDAKNGKLEKMPKSAISPTEWIDKFASGLTGTGIMIAGAISAALGIARAGFNKNDPEDQIAKMAGEQEYSIRPGKLTDLELIGEDVSMTLDWAAPSVLSYFTGVGLQEYFEKNGFSVGGALDLLMEVTEPMLNMSFMSGVSDLFKNNNYSTKDGFWQFIEKTGINFITSLIPTLSGQIASTVNGRRTTYSGGESLTGDPDIDRMVQQIGNKIPWLNLGGVPYTNDLGEESEPVIASWAENLLSPAYFSRVDESSEMQELARLYLTDPQNNKTILPAKPKQTIKINGQDISLNGEEYTKLKADHGAVWRDTIQSLLNNPLYQMASDDSRAAMFDMADQYATQAAKYMTDSRYKMETWAESAYMNGNAGDVIINKVAAKNKQYYVEGQTKSLAEALMTNNTQDIQKYADELNQSNASPSDVRKQLTAYFKPLYKQAYQNNDVTTMADIEFILTNINGYLDLEKPVTKYTKKKDFDKWITSTDTVTDTEDEDQNDWLNP